MAGSSHQPFCSARKLRRGHAKRFGRSGQVRLVRGEEIEDRAEDPGIGEPGAQRFGREPGQIEQTLGAALAGEEPAERTEGKGLRIGGG